MTTMEKYTYSALEDKTDFRVLTLEPGVGLEPLRCSLAHHPLAECAEFEAISYVWGAESDRHMLICSERQLEITSNLYGALKQLRYPDKKRILWADAVCINQDDFAERSNQVLIMGKIYANARQVVVWLGPESEDDCKAFGIFTWLDGFWGNCNYQRNLQSETVLMTRFYTELIEHWGDQDHELDHVLQLLQRPWFERIWVIQEVAKARSVLMLCGNLKILFDTFSSGYWLFYKLGFNLTCNPIKAQSRVDIQVFDAPRTVLKNRPVGLLRFLCLARRQQSSDPRDKLYAMLGMMESFDPQVIPDYNKSAYEIFRDFAIMNLIDCKQLRVLSCTAVATSASTSQPLPSWVPDWSVRTSSTYPIVLSTGAALNAAGNTDAEFRISPDLTELTIKGEKPTLIDGSVSALLLRFSETFAVENSVDPAHVILARITDFLQWLEECHQLALGSSSLGAGSHDRSTYEDFLRSLLGDLGIEMYPHGAAALQCLTMVCDEGPGLLRLLKDSDSDKFIELLSENDTVKYTIQRLDECCDSYLHRAQHFNYCRTSTGHLGYMPADARPEDCVCVFYGAEMLYVLRPQEEGHYTLVGECYLQGLMNGEALGMDKNGPQEFRIR